VARILDHAGNVVVTTAGMGAAVKSVSWSSDALQLVLGVYDGTSRVVDARTGRDLCTLAAARLWPRAVSWNHRSGQIAVGTFDGQPEVFTAQERPAGRPAPGGPSTSTASPRTASTTWPSPRMARYSWPAMTARSTWCPGTRELAPAACASSGGSSKSLLNTVARSSRLGLVAAGAFSRQVTIWEHDGTVLGGLAAGGPVNKVAWHPSEPVVAIADYSGTVTMAQVRDGRVIKGDSRRSRRILSW
jgi:WD40 repeat protein